MNPERKPKVVIAKIGLDGHDRGAKVVARALKDSGMEVVYTGIRQTPQQVAETVLQEDADALGISILSGAHLELFPRVIEALREREIIPQGILLFSGGIIPEEDTPMLESLGFKRNFGPGSNTNEIVEFVKQNIPSRL